MVDDLLTLFHNIDEALFTSECKCCKSVW